jgi:hypothetical protein
MNLKLATLVTAAVSLVGCGGGDGDFTLKLNGYGPHAGTTVRLKLLGGAAHSSLGTTSGKVANDGTLELVLSDVIKDKGEFTANWFADNNGDGACAPCAQSSGEHAWQKTVTASDKSDQSITHTHDTIWTDISPF